MAEVNLDVAMESTVQEILSGSQEILEKVTEGVNFNLPTAYAGDSKYAEKSASYNVEGKGVGFASFRSGGYASFKVDGNTAFTLGNPNSSDAITYSIPFNHSLELKVTESMNGGTIAYVLYE